MRLKLLLVSLGVAFLLLTGFFPGTLPFNPGARYSDAATSHFPAAHFLQKSVLEQHQFPVWRETIMAGAPFAANPLNKTAYPLQWFALVLPPALHLDSMILLHLFIAGMGMWRWARTLGLRSEAAALSALAYAMAPRVIGHTGAGHLDLLYALAWFPWLMEAVYRFVALPSNLSPIPERERRRLFDGCTSDQMKWIVRITLFAALIFLADTRLSLFAFGTAAAYGLYENARTRGWNKLVWTIPFLIVFVLLTLSVSVPLIGWSPYLSRTGLTVQEAGVFSLEPAHFVGLILPPQSGNIEMLTYVGLSVLVLAGLALVMMPRKLAFWLALLIFAALYALGANGFLWSFLVQIVPGLIWFRVPSRAWFIVVLVAPLLAGYGMQWLIERMGSRAPQRWRLYALIGLAASLACGISTLLVLPLPDAAGWSVLIGGGGLTLVVFAWLNGRLSMQRGMVLILIVVFADLLITGRSWLEWRGEEDWLVPYETLATRLIEENAARIYSPSYSLPQQVAEAYNLRLFGGVDPFQIESVVAAIVQAGGIEQVGYSVVVPPLNGIVGDDPATANRDAIPDTELLAGWEVSHVIAAYPIEHPRLEIVNELDEVYIYRNQDYTAPVSTDTLPNWSLDETKLPAPATVEQLNRLTLVASVIAGFTLIMVLILALKMRH